MKSTPLLASVLAAFVVAGATLPVSAAPQAAASQDARVDPLKQRADYIREHYTKFEYRIPMRDGKRLFTSVYVPNDADRKKTYPVLMVRTPYSIAPYGADQYKGMLGPTAEYEKEGYIFAFQDVRGTYMSEGEFLNMRPHIDVKRGSNDVDESSDTYDTIDWLIRHLPQQNGKFGQWGISYPGFYTSAGAIDSHPALKAISPQAPIADWFRGDDMHRNGALNLSMAFTFFHSFGVPRPEPTEKRGWREFNYGTPDAYEFFLKLGPLTNVNANHFKGGIPFWNDIIAHPDYDQFWQSRNLLPHLKNIKAAVLTVGGWYDTEDLYGPLQTYKAIEKLNPGIQNTLVIGPWIHGGWTRSNGDQVGDAHFGYKTVNNYQPVELAFFRHHLKGAEQPRLPEAWMFETGANRWRGFDSWPPQQVKDQTLYFHADGKLRFSAPAEQQPAFDEYLSDPAKPVPYTTEIMNGWSKNYVAADQRFASSRPDVLSWETDVLEQDVTLAGPLEADLFVSVTGSDADFVVKLIDVSPPDLKEQGVQRGHQQTLVRGEPFRARYRQSFSQPLAMVPGQITPVRFSINDVLHTFKRGHKIMVQVQSSWFPFIDRNPQTFVPNIYEAKASDFIKANHRVYRSAGQASALRVKVLPAIDARPEVK
ncbi:CocE/NonD family hydrolase [Undibacterium crateris]|uniref:CocE/NonD family hydrolase n=1 Tax=Undibacterium crateris TaxID=2528175 RepID=UPI001389B90F|nr:CocE/NonD family hydrolase [Undibacterium crateris]NDI85014.1 CocE/NonD family hydrolase [Undibacterium crateris]